MKLKLLAAVLLAGAAFSSYAADQTIDITANQTYSFNSNVPGDGVLSGGEDVLSFTGLGAGAYQVLLTFSGNFVSITGASLNGQAPTTLSYDPVSSLGKFWINANSPFTLTLLGTATNPALASYSGQITVTAVPEPATYGMLLGGLGLMGLVARRRKQQQ
ncbi:FxDxF family PEP-CTERM protein [Duganella sp. P38]|uniref:FxDxF family PEP-CTERM protein n=1 Tax=Duganella sp. P38 TaxID=3423949 RepID=UPI003D7ABE8B